MDQPPAPVAYPFVDMSDDLKYSFEPLLPNLTFKVRTGDSLVQRIGSKTLPVQGHANLPHEVKRKITQLKQKKRDFSITKAKITVLSSRRN